MEQRKLLFHRASEGPVGPREGHLNSPLALAVRLFPCPAWGWRGAGMGRTGAHLWPSGPGLRAADVCAWASGLEVQLCSQGRWLRVGQEWFWSASSGRRRRH